MESREDLIRYRLARANETLEDARILAELRRWNACVDRLDEDQVRRWFSQAQIFVEQITRFIDIDKTNRN